MSTTPQPLADATLPRPAPTPADERVVVIDVLRGFALFGILIVNMTGFSMPFASYWLNEPWWSAPADRAAMGLIRILFEGKFFLLFSLLFGLGMALQMERIEARGSTFGRLYARRLLALLLFGECHIIFFWWGDILATYALVGFVLLLVRRWRTTTLLLLAAIVYALALGASALLALLAKLAELDSSTAQDLADALADQQEYLADLTYERIVVYAHGTLAAIQRLRLQEFRESLVALFFMVPGILAMFLVGRVVGRHGIVLQPANHRRLLTGLACVGLPIGLALNVAWVVVMEQVSPAEVTWLGVAGYGFYLAGAPLATSGYAATLVLLWQRAAWQHWLRPLAAVGRMALTNYLLQTLVCTTIFYSYGLGWYGALSPAAGLALTVAIFAIQIPLSGWWLRRFRFGPLEWLWRCLTYARWQPLRLPRVGLPPPTQGLVT
jgi:uncharacterized protein